MAKCPRPESGNRTGGYKDRPWIPRIWEGICFTGWIRLLVQNRLMIAPHRIPMALIVAGVSLCVNSVFWAVQALVYGRKIEQTEIKEHPIFVIGHWRTGTTLLHELMVLDPRHAYPTTYECFAPNHFLVSRSSLGRFAGLLAPSQRPQDDMPFGLDRPQEDEFALCNMGVPSSYRTMAFPNRPPQCQEYLDMDGVPPEALARWKRALLWFLKCVTLRSPKRIVLKSPPHLGRIRVLLEMFPDARFVHIYRDPYVVFASTMGLWRRFYRDQGLQSPKYEGLEQHVFETFNRMYRAFRRDRRLVAPSRLCEVSYEALVADVIGQVRRIYEQLELGGFDAVRPALEEFVAAQAEYRPNRYEISPETRAEIGRQWAWYIKEYGYGAAPDEAPQCGRTGPGETGG